MSQPLRVAYIFERYPALSQTFLRREITALGRHGLTIEIHALFKIKAEAKIVPPLERVSVNYFRRWEIFKLAIAVPRELLRDPGLLKAGWRGWQSATFSYSENFWSTLWAVGYAFCRAPQFRREKPDCLHGVRATAAATAAAVLSRLCGIPYSFGAHAYDIYRHGGDAWLRQKLLSARFVHTTTETAANHLREIAGGPTAKIILARRGLLELPERGDSIKAPICFEAAPLPASKSRGEGTRTCCQHETGSEYCLPEKMPHPSPTGAIRLLSVGRLVAKKGHARQLAACRLLKQWKIPFALRIVGAGPLRGQLKIQIQQLGLVDEVEMLGALTSAQVEKQYRWADIFWHTGVVDAAGDRDGLPNVIPEAMAHGLPVIASQLPELREAVTHHVTGWIVDASDAAELARAVQQLAENPARRAQLGENGRQWVEANFMIAKNSEILAEAFKRRF